MLDGEKIMTATTREIRVYAMRNSFTYVNEDSENIYYTREVVANWFDEM